MEKCRICLGNKKTLMCIFEGGENVSYADMMVSIANIKIEKHNGITDKICRSCRKSLREAYDFKLLIERSDVALCENANLKKIKFNNINDIKVEVQIEFDSKPFNRDIVKMEEDVDEFSYNDTVIKKVANPKTDAVCLKPIPVLDFLKTIKSGDDNFNDVLQDYDGDSYGVDSDCDGDYIPPHNLIDNKKQCNKRKSRTQKKYTDGSSNDDYYNNDDCGKGPNYDGDCIPPHYKRLKTMKPKRNRKKKVIKNIVSDVCIKPIYLRDIIAMKSKPVRKKVTKEKNPQKVKPLVCPHCGILTKSIKSHIQIHIGERKYKCNECDKRFYNQSGLAAHNKFKHTPRLYKCDECTAALPTENCLKKHKVTHQTEMKHVCDICSKAFKRRSTLLRHRIMHNSANKTIMCDLCNMSFFTKVALRHHSRIHTGERPYKCEICSQPYSYKHDFNRHCLKKHGVFLKRRSVYVMNEEVLKQERILMKELMLRINGIIKDDKPINPFEGPQAALAFEQTIKALEERKIPIDFPC